jgi:hypothetical protein
MRVPPNPRPVTPHPFQRFPSRNGLLARPFRKWFVPPHACRLHIARLATLTSADQFASFYTLLPRRGALARSIPPLSPGIAPPPKPACRSQLPDASLPPPPCSCALLFLGSKTCRSGLHRPGGGRSTGLKDAPTPIFPWRSASSPLTVIAG